MERLMLIASWNVNSITVRLGDVLDWLANVQPDVLCLQETKIVDEKFPASAFKQAGYCSVFAGQPTYNGVAILAKSQLTDIKKELPLEENKKSERFIQANIKTLTIVNTYVPNGQAVGSEKFSYKLSFLRAVKTYFSTQCNLSQSLIWCGDFNIAPEGIDTYDPATSDGQIMCSSEERELLEEIKSLGFIDTFRQHNTGPVHFSWWDYRMGAFRRNLGYRIDHIWTSKSLSKRCTKAWIDKEPRKSERPSDHAPVLAELDI